LVRHEQNLGSAGGYHSGLEYILDNKVADYIWILDDDNLPFPGSLKALFLARDLLLEGELTKDTVVYSYRGDSRADDKKAVTEGYIKGYSYNNFGGFDFFRFLENRLFKKK
jgi:GT2 family glycosyltransferase